METVEESLDRLSGLVGRELGPSSWETFDQAALDAYGAITGEALPVHCDPVRAAAGRFGGTIVQASLLLARLGSWVQESGGWIADADMPLNYGYDRVRFLAPVPVGHPVRGRFVLTAIERRPADTVLLRFEASVEMRDCDRPAIVASWIIGFLINPKDEDEHR